MGIYCFLEKVYPIIKESVPEVRLDLVGGGVTKRLERVASEDKSIRVLGYVDDPVPYIQKACAYIIPILSGSGTRLKILEAMSSGKAIISTSIGCEGIEGKNMEHFLIADRPDEFAEATFMVLKDAGLRTCLGENARRLAIEKYDWNVITEKLDQLYMKAAENQVQKMAYT